MRIWTSLVPSSSEGVPRGDQAANSVVAVVIDVLRATTVVTTALASGATEVFTCLDIAEAFELSRSLTPRPLLCGERHCRPIDGFDIGNSPAEYTADRVGSKSLVMTTTNGTRAIRAAQNAREMVLASFLNLDAVVEFVVRFDVIHLVCAGTDGHITGEDVLLAGGILERLSRLRAATYENDSCQLATSYWNDISRRGEENFLEIEFAKTIGGRNLIAAGYASDLAFCAKINSTRVVPCCHAGGLGKHRSMNRFLVCEA